MGITRKQYRFIVSKRSGMSSLNTRPSRFPESDDYLLMKELGCDVLIVTCKSHWTDTGNQGT